ncbi:non-homologous end-joining DNA ligase [Angustibacter peucedani]
MGPVRPMLATPAAPGSRPPEGDAWVHEVKWDGMRMLAEVTDGRLRLTSRTESDVTAAFPELAGLAEVMADGLLDGEVVAIVDGRPDFGALAERWHVREARRAAALAERFPVSYVVFDVMRLYGVPLVGRAFDERRHTLERLDLGDPADAHWQVPGVFDDGAVLLEATRESGLEGVVSKRRASTYQPGRRSRDWVKRAHRSSQTCVVGGWRPQTGTTSTPASLLVGLPDGAGGLTFLGKVGSGIGPTASADLTRRLGPLATGASPFTSEVPAVDQRGTSWVRPELCVEVEHLGYGSGGRLRQPAFRGVRTDVTPEELRREP